MKITVNGMDFHIYRIWKNTVTFQINTKEKVDLLVDQVRIIPNGHISKEMVSELNAKDILDSFLKLKEETSRIKFLSSFDEMVSEKVIKVDEWRFSDAKVLYLTNNKIIVIGIRYEWGDCNEGDTSYLEIIQPDTDQALIGLNND